MTWPTLKNPPSFHPRRRLPRKKIDFTFMMKRLIGLKPLKEDFKGRLNSLRGPEI